MPLDVDKVLKASSASSDQRESVKVSRPLPVSTLDLGNLLLVEGNSLPGGVTSAASEAREEAVRAVARDNAQVGKSVLRFDCSRTSKFEMLCSVYRIHASDLGTRRFEHGISSYRWPWF